MIVRCCFNGALAVGLLVFGLGFPEGKASERTVAQKSSGESLGKYLGPATLAASRDGSSLYVACADGPEVACVSLPGGEVIRRVPMPFEPTGIVLSPDETRLIVTCAAPHSVVLVLEADSGKRLGRIPVGHTAMGPAVSPNGRRAYVCNRFSGNVSVIDLAAGKEVARVRAAREPIASAVSPNGRAVLVANHLSNVRTDRSLAFDVTPLVTVIDTHTHETTSIELPHGANNVRGLCITPDGKHALVTHLLANFERTPFRVDTGWINVNVLSILDIAKRKVISTIGMDRNDLGAGNPHDVAITADGSRVVVSLAGTHELCVIDRVELLGEFAHRTMQPMMGVWPIYLSLGESLWRRVKLTGNGPRGLAVAGSTVFVAQYFSDSVALVDLDKLRKPAEGASPGGYGYSAGYADDTKPGESAARTIPLGPASEPSLARRGERLFHDATLCYQQWVSCASCHPDGRVDGLNWDLLNDGQGNPKNTKSVLFADQTPPAMAEAVRATAGLAVRSGIEHILFSDRPEAEAAAIDAYIESLRPVPSPHLVGGRLGASAKRGRVLFESHRVGCGRCHPAPLYTDLKVHNVGTQGQTAYTDRFDTPTLVEVWRTAPYLHDGRHVTILGLLAEGRHGLGPHQTLTPDELDDLVAFVLSL